ncbi:hypothetical protein J7T55_000737 [Diaporthe amygdali]|uniref:uncharacterized protein n=1 Tax=Phomopsis amygdali TaxID=1214568 RepID=UPI0022FDFDAC|nr:uncharacterized protein J7T55_000737 [Diaporthe amygdali]KAJ0110304.1 hypothetical protein J7T55_000737 [Diaporthe amygdali]
MSLPVQVTSYPLTANTAITLILISLAWAVIYPLYISSLKHVPGPKLGAITSLYINRRYYNESAILYIKSLHDKYGHIIRVGPNEVVLDDPKQLSIIYGVRSTFTKPSTAVLFENYGFPNVFSSVTREQHRDRRKQVAHIYTMNAHLNNASLMNFIRNRLEKLLEIIDRGNDRVTDVYTLAGYFALDNVSYMVYGESLDSMGGQNLRAADDIRNLAIASTPFVRFAWLFTKASSLWPWNLLLPKFIAKAITSRDSLAAINQELIARMTSSDSRVDPNNTVLGYMQSQPEYGQSITKGHVQSECFDHILAGADTTAASIAYSLYVLSLAKNQQYQERLRQEVSQLSWPLDFKAVGPGSLQQRVTPLKEATHVNVQGIVYKLAPGTIIGIQAYSLHRNQDVFGAAPEEFKPGRWEIADEERLKAMKKAWIPFGSGARTCLGLNLAIIELKAALAAVFRHYNVELDPNTDPDGMSPIFAAVIRPKAEKCNLVFTKNRQPTA